MEDAERGVWGVKTEAIQQPKVVDDGSDEQFQNLVETGYSPEVARAIVASEEALRGRSGK